MRVTRIQQPHTTILNVTEPPAVYGHAETLNKCLIHTFMDVNVLSFDIDKLERIPEGEVPFKKRTKWDKIFESIPKGEAVVIPEEMAHPTSVRQALARRQRQGRFNELQILSRGRRGQRKTYIVNPK